jgi:carbohydrate-binding DOMON domain-containing protein
MHCWVHEQNNIYLDHLKLWLSTTGYFVSRQMLSIIRVYKLNKKLIPQFIYTCCHRHHWYWYTTNSINSKSHCFFLMKAEIWSEPNCRICTPSKTYQLLHKLPSWNSGEVLFKSSYLRTSQISVVFVHSKMLVPHTYECLRNKYFAK